MRSNLLSIVAIIASFTVNLSKADIVYDVTGSELPKPLFVERLAVAAEVSNRRESQDRFPNVTIDDKGARNSQPNIRRRTASSTFQLGAGFAGPAFLDNGNLNGVWNIPPDPIGTAGKTSVIAVVNVIIEIRSKQGTILYKQGLPTFFTSLGPSRLFDPKVVYDEYADRFVVVVLDRVDTAPIKSTILLAVSKTGSPTSASDWYFQAIDSLISDAAGSYWADYPGLEVSPEAVYVTNNMFSFADNSYFGGRLWIIAKTGFYTGGTLSYTIHNPSQYFGLTLMPALVYGGPIGNNVGTFLVGYSGLRSGSSSLIYVMKVADPLGTPTFSHYTVNLGAVDTFASTPKAPQLGTTNTVDTGDRRVLDAAWRGNSLWLTTSLVPVSGVNANQATAYWVKISTNTFLLEDKGEIGGEDLGTGTYTSYASVAINSQGVAAFGFAASGPSIYPGAYVAGRYPSDPSGTVSSSYVVHQGIDYYYRTFSGTRNRWGDYSGIAIDPVDDSFWVFNEYADTRGSSDGGDGKWNTAWVNIAATTTLPPTGAPTRKPTTSPTAKPSAPPTGQPTLPPTGAPTRKPTTSPTAKPSTSPTAKPSTTPTRKPTTSPTAKPSAPPTGQPTLPPTGSPTGKPTTSPTAKPSTSPTVKPSTAPTTKPTVSPTGPPTPAPTAKPSVMPSTSQPTLPPSVSPTRLPTSSPTAKPSTTPVTSQPTGPPSFVPTRKPTSKPTSKPSAPATRKPSTTGKPTSKPTGKPSAFATRKPTIKTTSKPTTIPTSKPAA